MSSLAATEPVTSIASVAVAGKTSSMHLRLSSALAGRPAFRLRAVSSLRRLIAAGSDDDVIVTYHEKLCSDDCESIKHLKATLPELLVVAVCQSADGRSVRRALDSGIDGLVFADELESALRPTVAAALAGQIAVPRDLRACVRKPALSAKERQVLSLLVMGLTNSEISAKVYLAESTVKSHLSSAYMKLGVRSRSEAVSLLIDSKGPIGASLGVVRG
jgi:DNA-binding NarL/FixJ family response regulator